MKKLLHFFVVATISVLTVVATITVIHDANRPQPDVLTTRLERAGRAVLLGPSHTVRNVSAGTTGWTVADFTRLGEIARKFAQSVTLGQWQTLAYDVQQQNGAATTSFLTKLLSTSLTLTDRTWLIRHFSGATPFTQEDAVLVQQAAAEFESSLTSTERQMLNQAAMKFLRQQ